MKYYYLLISTILVIGCATPAEQHFKRINKEIAQRNKIGMSAEDRAKNPMCSKDCFDLGMKLFCDADGCRCL